MIIKIEVSLKIHKQHYNLKLTENRRTLKESIHLRMNEDIERAEREEDEKYYLDYS